MKKDRDLHKGDLMAGRPNKKDSAPRCVLCGKGTATVYNINLEAISICGDCGLSITKQEVSSWGRT